jgi:hypothetical protein
MEYPTNHWLVCQFFDVGISYGNNLFLKVVWNLHDQRFLPSAFLQEHALFHTKNDNEYNQFNSSKIYDEIYFMVINGS